MHRQARPPSPTTVRRLVAVVVGAAALLGVVACSGSGSNSDSGGSGSKVSAPAPTVQSSALQTVGPSTAPTTTVDGLPADPLTYANRLFEAWRTGDRTTAGQLATDTALTDLFAHAWSAKDGWKGPSCSADQGVSTCTWTGTGKNRLSMELPNRELGRHGAVTKVTRAGA